MPRKKTDDLELAKRKLGGKRFVWVERPTLLHNRATEAGQCGCGCQSWSGECEDERAAILVERIQGPEMLLDRWTGARKLRAAQSELDGSLEAFDAFKRGDKVEHVVLPRRCYREQLLGLNARPKVKGFFGGSRGGKTQLLAEEAVDAWFELGGPGVKLWWVAPELADCQRGVNKLVLGEAIRGGIKAERRPPIFHPSLVLDFPGRENVDGLLEQIKRRKPLRLVDGTVIEFRYAGRGGSIDDQDGSNKRGGNLKGDVCAWIGVDEGAEIMSSSTWHTLIQRTTDSGGWLTTATTPKVGSPLKHLIYDEGKDLAANDGDYLTGYIQVSMELNPWMTTREVSRTIGTLMLEPNGEDLVKQDVKGAWIVPGGKMWQHFDESVHVVEGPSRDIERYQVDGRQLMAITRMVADGFFEGTTSDLTRVGGQDFNLRGHFTVVVQIGVPDGLDADDQGNWVVFVEDEVRKAGEPAEAARHLSGRRGSIRSGLPKEYFANLAIACDSTGAQDRLSESATGNVRAMFTPCAEFVKAGFDMRPCHRSDNDKPMNPEKVAQQQVLHKLMMRHDLGQNGERYAAGDVAELPPSTRLLIHKARAPELIKGLREQKRNRLGFLRKRSDTRDDRISDPVDALLYILWALFEEAECRPRASVHM